MYTYTHIRCTALVDILYNISLNTVVFQYSFNRIPTDVCMYPSYIVYLYFFFVLSKVVPHVARDGDAVAV